MVEKKVGWTVETMAEQRVVKMALMMVVKLVEWTAVQMAVKLVDLMVGRSDI